MERMIRVVLFLALGALGLDGSEDARLKQQLAALKPPHSVNAPTSPPPPPPLGDVGTSL
jgi:hypothetical protein